jgi:NAD(P)-dependent dehydrogenase (short-subunit alcohol dehydrogenase family)
MSMTTDPKVILITGASSGLGAAMAQRFAAAGHRVYGGSRHIPSARLSTQAPKVSAGRTAINEAIAPVQWLALDVTDTQSVDKAVAHVLAHAARIDVLINNAGNGIIGAIEDTHIDEARAQFDTNYFGVVNMLRAVLPVMRAQQQGRIITIGSLAGEVALPYQAHYSASKAALNALNEALRHELRDELRHKLRDTTPSDIDATLIAPGDFKTGFTDARRIAAHALSRVHAQRLESSLARYAHDERNGADPEHVAALALRLITVRKLRPRYRIGRLDQRLGAQLKQWLPDTVFEFLMRKIYPCA